MSAGLVQRIWQELSRAPHDRHHDWRTPVLATLGRDGSPQARTVVLRGADRVHRCLTVYTDARTPKCDELRAQPAAQLIFWSARLAWQLRVSARAAVFTQGELVRTAWEQIRTSRSASDYLSPLPPGSPCGDGDAAGTAGPVDPEDHHLAVLRFEVVSIDWLELHRDGHRRAMISAEGDVEARVP